MIPLKDKQVNLENQLDKEIEEAEKKSKEDIKNSKPKLAQSVAIKYTKYITILVLFIIVIYKMFFSNTDTKTSTKKKKVKSKVSVSKTEQQQKVLEASSAGKVNSKPATMNDKTQQQIVSLSSQTLSNAETLSSVAVPKLTLPTQPSIPEIKTITISKEVENRDKQKELEKQLEAQKAEIEQLKSLQKQLQDNTRLVETSPNRPSNIQLPNSPISNIGNNSNNSSKNNNRNTKNTKDNDKISDIIENMFLISSNSSSSGSSKSSSIRDDFFIVDGSSIYVKEPVSNSSSNNVTKLTNQEYTIATGRVIEGVLETAINSESSGTIRAVISKDVLGEVGNHILIPMGSRLYGSYTVTTTITQSRLLLTWNKIIRPDGIVVSMSADTYDQIGRKGIEGEINTRYGELFKNSLLYSFITLGTAIAVEKLAGIKGTNITSNGAVTSTTISPAATAAQSVVESVKNIAEKMTDGLTDDLNSVISIPQGQLLKIMPSSDIVITTPYKRRVKNIELD